MQESDEQLVHRAQQGDEQALATLLERAGLELHAQLEARIGPRYRGQFNADDILQVSFLEAFLRVRSLEVRGHGSFMTWLRKIAEHNLLDAIRELERDKRPAPSRRVEFANSDDSYVALVEQMASASSAASRVCAREELRQCVDAALRELPAEYEQALRLFELQGLSGEEVALKMGRSHGAVRMLLARARERLAELLGSDSRFFSKPA
ncbi:MAG: RNA polymerase sigma factor [Phycisphaerae bacterium]